jgi:hypothetical protein
MITIGEFKNIIDHWDYFKNRDDVLIVRSNCDDNGEGNNCIFFYILLSSLTDDHFFMKIPMIFLKDEGRVMLDRTTANTTFIYGDPIIEELIVLVENHMGKPIMDFL